MTDLCQHVYSMLHHLKNSEIGKHFLQEKDEQIMIE